MRAALIGIVLLLCAAAAWAQTRQSLLQEFAAQAANLVLAGPSSGASATPSFRALVFADMPSVNKYVAAEFMQVNGGI